MKEKILAAIEVELSKLDDEDAESHVWWLRFREFINDFDISKSLIRNQDNEISKAEEEFLDNIDGDINNIEGFLYHEECGDR